MTTQPLENSLPFAFPVTFPRVSARAIFAIIFILALLLRAITLNALEISHDEAYSVFMATSERGLLVELQNDANAPLYFYPP